MKQLRRDVMIIKIEPEFRINSEGVVLYPPFNYFISIKISSLRDLSTKTIHQLWPVQNQVVIKPGLQMG